MERENGALRFKLLWIGGGLLIAGLAIVFFAAWREQSLLAAHPWRGLLIAVEAETVPEGAVSLRARPLPETNLPPESQRILQQMRMQSEGEQLLALLGYSRMENLLMVEAGPELFADAVVSGRLPEAGKPEVLAGGLARFDSFEMGGVQFEVVGRLDSLVPGTLTAYFLPAHPDFETLYADTEEATNGWLDRDGMARLSAEKDEQPAETQATRFLMPLGRLPLHITAVTMCGMVFIAAGGALAQISLLAFLAPRTGKVFGPCLRELVSRPRLLAAVHVLLYGALFGAMAIACTQPRSVWNAVQFTQSVFSEGELGYIGRAYQSGNILMATLATLNQNYFMGTCLYSVLPSLIIPFAGVLKNLVSFLFVGFIMAPLWTGNALQNTYHSITLTLELEAYVVASFAVCVLPIRVVSGFRDGDWATQYMTGLRVVASAVFVVGLMLTIAAAYEATSIILANRL